jgi:hypothetical protein
MLVNSTPSFRLDAANEARSTLDRMISLYRFASRASASPESGNAGQSCTEAPNSAASASVTGAPNWSPRARIERARIAGYASAGWSASLRAS